MLSVWQILFWGLPSWSQQDWGSSTLLRASNFSSSHYLVSCISELYMTQWALVSSQHPMVLTHTSPQPLNLSRSWPLSPDVFSLLPFGSLCTFSKGPLYCNYFYETVTLPTVLSRQVRLFLWIYAYRITITFMYVSLTGLLTCLRARVLSFNLCITSNPKSMLCCRCAFSNHLLDEWTNEPQTIFQLMPRKCSTWNGDMRCVLRQCLVIEVSQLTDKTGRGPGGGIGDGLRWQKMPEVGKSFNFSINESGGVLFFVFQSIIWLRLTNCGSWLWLSLLAW